jgi:hypothetical protein
VRVVSHLKKTGIARALCLKYGLTYMQFTPDLLEYWKNRKEESDKAKP